MEQREGLLLGEARVGKLWVEDGRCCGVQVLDGPLLHWIRARAVVLATGMALLATNPAQAAGEGGVGWLVTPPLKT